MLVGAFSVGAFISNVRFQTNATPKSSLTKPSQWAEKPSLQILNATSSSFVQPLYPPTQELKSSNEFQEVLGFFETHYTTGLHYEDRVFNLRLAASKLNGKVLKPYEIFDFNEVVGPRDEENGYRLAKVIADGELVDGMGGGTCQIAGTLHAAAFFAGLDIVQRSPHTRPSSYIKMGLDAVVAYSKINLKIRNPFPFPIQLRETVSNGIVRAEILGLRRTRMVTFIRKIEEIFPFAEREQLDAHLPKGKKILVQRGIPGFKVRRYRVVREGVHATRERFIDTYPPTTQIWHIGTGEDSIQSSSKLAQQDSHPEYVADEFLSITQGPGVGRWKPKKTSKSTHALVTGMEEIRIPGETGVYGWTRKHAEPGVHFFSEPKSPPLHAVAQRKTLKRHKSKK